MPDPTPCRFAYVTAFIYNMITIISGTNRKNSEAALFADLYCSLLQQNTREEVRLLKLENVPHDWFHTDMYEQATQSSSLTNIQNEFILPAQRFVFVVPEYNGSFPGVLKLFIDACSIRDYKLNFGNKKIALVGIASGRAGNLRGLDHLTGILNHLGAVIYPDKVHIASVPNLKDSKGNIADNKTLQVLKRQAKGFLNF